MAKKKETAKSPASKAKALKKGREEPSRIRTAIRQANETKVGCAVRLAKSLEISQPSMSKFLNGQQGLEYRSIERLVEALDIMMFDGSTDDLCSLIASIDTSGMFDGPNIKRAIELLTAKLDEVESPSDEDVARYLSDRTGHDLTSEYVRYLDGWAFVDGRFYGCEDEKVTCYRMDGNSIYAETFDEMPRKQSPFARLSNKAKTDLVGTLNEKYEVYEQSRLDQQNAHEAKRGKR